MGEITFSAKDMLGNEITFHDAVVIQAVVENYTVSRILVDNRSSVNVVFKKAFDEMMVEEKRVTATNGPLFDLSGERKEIEGGVELLMTLGGTSKNCKFAIVDAPNSYNTSSLEEGGEEVDTMLEGMTRLEVVEEAEEKEIMTKGGSPEKVKINEELDKKDKEKILSYIQENANIFTWSAANMSGVDADVVCHHLNLDYGFRLIQQKKGAIATNLVEPI